MVSFPANSKAFLVWEVWVFVVVFAVCLLACFVSFCLVVVGEKKKHYVLSFSIAQSKLLLNAYVENIRFTQCF